MKQLDGGLGERGRSEGGGGGWPVLLEGAGPSWQRGGSAETLTRAGSPQARVRSAFSRATRRPGGSGDGQKG